MSSSLKSFPPPGSILSLWLLETSVVGISASSEAPGPWLTSTPQTPWHTEGKQKSPVGRALYCFLLKYNWCRTSCKFTRGINTFTYHDVTTTVAPANTASCPITVLSFLCVMKTFGSSFLATLKLLDTIPVLCTRSSKHIYLLTASLSPLTNISSVPPCPVPSSHHSTVFLQIHYGITCTWNLKMLYILW